MHGRDAGWVSIPREIDMPPKFFLWDWDGVALFTAGFSFGVLSGSFLVGLVLGSFFAWWWNRARSGQAQGYGLFTVYWFFPINPFKRLPASHRRDFQG